MQDHHSTNESFDVIVIGGGHAGCEAAITTAKLGFSTALFTINLDRIAWQPCNPAVGGPAKSQLVHEVDALGGIIGKLSDETAMFSDNDFCNSSIFSLWIIVFVSVNH